MASQIHYDTEALVIGAGPTGLFMAAELIRRGVACRVIDKAPAPSSTSKALALQSRTLEMFDQVGIIEEILEPGLKAGAVNIHADGQRIIQMSMNELHGPYPFILCLPQNQTERILNQHLERLGGQVERQRELIGFTQDDAAVTATLRHADGHEETLTTRWLIGCDGAHSAVRHTLNMPFNGVPYPEAFALADVKLDWPLPNDQIDLFLSEHGLLGAFPMQGGRYRLIIETKADAGDEKLSDPTLEEIQGYLTKLAPEGSVASDPAWLAAFRSHLRHAEHIRQGRVFLAGDAAHIHSPAGGQGMNTGLQDAYNLAWKLALVNAGHASPTLLDTYEIERKPVAESVLRTSDLMIKAATLRSPITQQIRNRLLPLLAQQDLIQQRMTAQIAELSVNYRKSPIVAEHHHERFMPVHLSHGPRAGDRAPDAAPLLRADGSTTHLYELLRGTNATLLLFADPENTTTSWQRLAALANTITARYGSLITKSIVSAGASVPEVTQTSAAPLLDPELALHRAYAASPECLYLVRPDGYIGFRSYPADEASLNEYLKKLFL
ncbi:MAG TPA: FAD-dependent monooxygenase [Ktedonobacterales bacterium]|nr:FAD-dependent monooxygenase [Ktedonobacterales bacterium]